MLRQCKAALQHVALYRGVRFAWHFFKDPGFRHDHVLRWRRPANLFQYRSFTAPNRYPRIFAFVRDQLRGVSHPRLLSFGCATGEEVFSLREYLPGAVIKGIDINRHNIAWCQRRLDQAGDSRITFQQSDSAQDEPAGHYDAVFCLAVFQHSALKNARHRTCDEFIRFEGFADAIGAIARTLRVGGYLAIRSADFRFSDTAVSADFEPVLVLPPSGILHPRFDRHNRRVPDEEDREVVYRRIR